MYNIEVVLFGDVKFYNFLQSDIHYHIVKDNELILKEKMSTEYHHIENLKFENKLQIIIDTNMGSIIYSIYIDRIEQRKLKEKYCIQGENYESLIQGIFQDKKRNMITLIMELKAYYFLHHARKTPLYSYLMQKVTNNIQIKYFRKRYFIFTPESEFSIMDIIEILLHLHEIYHKGLKIIDNMIDKTLEYLKDIKIKNKRLNIYK